MWIIVGVLGIAVLGILVIMFLFRRMIKRALEETKDLDIHSG